MVKLLGSAVLNGHLTHDDGLATGINYLILVGAKFGRKSSIGIGIGGIQCQFLVRHGDRRYAYAISIRSIHM